MPAYKSLFSGIVLKLSTKGHLVLMSRLTVQAAATQEAAPKTNNQKPTSEYQLKTLTLFLLKVCRNI